MAFRTRTHRRHTVAVGLATALVLAASFLVGPATRSMAAEDDGLSFFELQGQRAWGGFSDARPISPYAGLPLEMAVGIPFSRSYLDSTPGRAEAFAALYYPSEIVEEGVLQTTGRYENPTIVRANNPDVGRGSEAKFGEPPGPHAAVQTPSRTEATSVASYGPLVSEELTLANSHANTTIQFNRDDLLTTESLSVISNVNLPGAFKIGTLESWVKMEYQLDQEPRISYRLALSEVHMADQPLAASGHQGVVLSGEEVLASEVPDQFQEQANEFGKSFPDLATGTMHLAEPRVEQDGNQYTVTAPVIEGRVDNEPRRGQLFGYEGIRLGWAQVHGYLTALGGDNRSDPGPVLGADESVADGSTDAAVPRAHESAPQRGTSAETAGEAIEIPPATTFEVANGGARATVVHGFTDPSRKAGLSSGDIAPAASHRTATNAANGFFGGMLVFLGGLAGITLFGTWRRR